MRLFNKIKNNKMISFIAILILILFFNTMYRVDFGIPILNFFVGLAGAAVGYVFLLYVIDWFIKLVRKFS